MKLIENILTDNVKDRLKEILLRDNFDWFYNGSTARIIPGNKSAIEDSNTKDSIQFTHKLFADGIFESEHVDYVIKIMKALEEKEGIVCTTMLRAKCNLVPQDISYGADQYHPPHVDCKDVTDTTFTLVYYVNDSDGDTFVFNEQYVDEFDDLTIAHRQTPKEGSALLFKSTNYHASSSPINTKSRVVINIVFESDETKRR
jgi:ectoine hydroxylase-related dioxygenase (phytanoyl-CoA dioxygenase family)